MGCPCDSFICQEPPPTTTTLTTTTSTTTTITRTTTTTTTTTSTPKTSMTTTSKIYTTTNEITTIEANSTTIFTSTTPRFFKNWRNDLFPTTKEFRLMASAVGFQLIFGFWLMVTGLYILDGYKTLIVRVFLFSLLVFLIVSPIVGFVSLYYEIQLFDDAVLSFTIYQVYAIMTTINISSVIFD